jgi:hypothetical protein
MPTGQQIITRAVTALNIIDDGGGISASESAGLLIELNAMVDAWATEETLIPSVSTAQYALTANKNPYSIGPGGDFDTARPVRIDGAYQISTVGSGTNRNKLRVIGSKEYFEHNDLSAAATSSDELYPDWADGAAGRMNLYLYPVPTCPTATFLEMQTWNPIAAFALGANQNLPNGYEDAIVYGLAYRCIPRYGAVVNQAVAEVITNIGKQAKDRIKTLNVQNRLLDPSLLPQQQQAAPPAGR